MSCCINGCYNTSKNCKEKKPIIFYRFPRNNIHMPWLNEKREKWINAVKNYTKYPRSWIPHQGAVLCSAHFVGGKKSENPKDPAYIPSIFPTQKKSQTFSDVIQTQRQMYQAKVELINAIKKSFPDDRSLLPPEPAEQNIGCLCGSYETSSTCICSVGNLDNLNSICKIEIDVEMQRQDEEEPMP